MKNDANANEIKLGQLRASGFVPTPHTETKLLFISISILSHIFFIQ